MIQSIKQLPYVEQGSDEWFAQRLGKVTGSNFGKVMTKSRNGKGFGDTARTYMFDQIGERLTGSPKDSPNLYNFAWGNHHEPKAAARYEYETGNLTQRVGFALHPTESEIGCSPDRFVGDDGCLEIKCPMNVANQLKTYDMGAEAIRKAYHWQCQGTLWITGRQWLDYVSYYRPDAKAFDLPDREINYPIHLQLIVIRFERDEKAIKDLAKTVVKFRDDMMQKYEQFLKGEHHG